jgi:hypothetical protein
MVDQQPREPKSLPLSRWNIFIARQKATLIGSVEAPDADAAIESVAKAVAAGRRRRGDQIGRDFCCGA